MIASALAGCTGGEEDVEVVNGCMDTTATNFMSDATNDDGTCTYDTDGDGTIDSNEVDTDGDGIDDNDEIEGCQDMAATNYDATATDSGSCDFDQSYYMGMFASGDMAYADAWSSLQSVRACAETGSNNPCEIVQMTIGDASTFDPHDAYDSASGDVIENVFDTLYRYEGDGNGNAIIVPRLATSHTISDDQLTYTFTLRDDVYFSNGDHMTAEDVVYSWERVNEMASPLSHVSWITEQNFNTSGLSMIDATHFSVTLTQPYAGFISTIAYTVGAVVNADLCEANRVVTVDDASTADVDESSDDFCHEWMDEAPLGAGTGAYVVESWVRETAITLTPNWMYWEDGGFNINRFTSQIVTEASTRLLAFQDGEADFGSLNIEDEPQFCDNYDDAPNVAGKDGYVCTYRESFTITLSAMNLMPKALDAGEANNNTDANSSLVLNWDSNLDGTMDSHVMASSAVRKAIAYSFDYDTARRDTYSGQLAPVYGPIPNGFLYDETQSQVFDYDLAVAEQALQDAGFIRQYDCTSLTVGGEPTVVPDDGSRDGTECRLPNVLRIMANEGNDYRIAMAGQIAQALGSIGVATDGDAKPWAEYLTMYYTSTFEIRFSGWAPDYLDPDNYWTPFAASHDAGGDAYGTNYHNAALDENLTAARVSTDDAERTQLYQNAFALWAEDPNMIIIGQGNGISVKRDDIVSAPWAAIGAAHWFDYDKLPVA